MIHLVEERSVRVLGNRIYLREAGRGTAVLFLHGFPTNAVLWTRCLNPVAEAGFHVIAPDLLGYGRSDHPSDRPLDLREQADLLAHLLTELGVASAHVVGHDLGGGVAQNLAVAHPEKVLSLVLVDPASFDSWPSPDFREIARALGGSAGADPETAQSLLHRLLPQGGSGSWEMPEEVLARFLEPWSDTHGAAALQRAAAALDNAQTAGLAMRIAEQRTPTSLVWGRLDPWQPVSYAQKWENAYPTADVQVLDAGHWVPLQAPDDLVAHLLRWLRGQAAPAAERARIAGMVSTHKADTLR